MRKNSKTRTNFKFGQTCDSRECRSKYKHTFIKNFAESVTTPHEYNASNKTITCLYCGKIRKLT